MQSNLRQTVIMEMSNGSWSFVLPFFVFTFLFLYHMVASVKEKIQEINVHAMFGALSLSLL